MSREYDLVVFGASGFTGQFVVEEVAKIAEAENLKWAIAGRSMPKLQSVLNNASKHTGKALNDTIDILMADVKSPQSLIEMASKTRLLLNCVGPFRFFGDDVVKACIEKQTHHIDICGEPAFLEKTQLLYHGKAKENNCYVIGACGFDSIPAEMGVAFMKKNFGGDVNDVENYAEFHSGPDGGCGNFGTWQSAIYGFAHQDELKTIRKSLFTTQLPKPTFRQERRGSAFHSDLVNGWCIPFVGSDRSIVQRTQRFMFDEMNERPIQFQAYAKVGSVFNLIGMAIFGVVFSMFAKFSFGRYLLETFPSLFSGGLFTKNGPTRKQIAGSSFTMTFVGKGWSSKLPVSEQHKEKPDKTMKVQIVAPECGYVCTPICFVQCALCVLKEADKLPSNGGVYTAGAAFEKTSLLERLQANQIKIKVV